MFSLIKSGFLQNHIHRKAVLLKIITNIIITVTLVSVWKSIYETNNMDLSINYLVSYTIISSGLTTIYMTNIIGLVSSQVKSGGIIFTVSKPKGMFYQLFYEAIGTSIFRFIYIVIPSYIVLFSMYQSNIQIASLSHFVFIFLLSYILMFLFDYIFGLFSIFSLNSWGLQSFKYALITIFSGSMIPIELYPQQLKSIVELLPFSKLYAVPIDAILLNSKISSQTVIEYIVTIFVFCIIALILEKFVTNKLVINGG